MPGWKSTYYLSEGSGLFAMQSLFLCLIRSELCFHTGVHCLGTHVRHYLPIEEVPVKWMDRPIATEMERGRASEMDRLSKCHKKENANEMNKIQ